MSARNAMAAMLDELMGPKRNVDLGKDTKVTFDDPDICKYFIVGFCPHEMFINTKIDLGACPLVHDENLRREYPTSPQFEKLGFEKDFLKFLTRMQDENIRRVNKNKDKLRSNEEYGQKKEDERKLRDAQELEAIDRESKQCMEEAEKAGAEGLVVRCQELVDKAEALEKRRSAIMERVTSAEIPDDINSQTKVMEVCDVCGSMLIKGDAQCRIEEHLMGKMHMGFTKIQVTIEELKDRLRKKEEEIMKERDKDREERKRPDDREKRRSKSRSRSRDRDRRGSRSNRDRSRSRERDRRGSGGRDHRGGRDDRDRYRNGGGGGYDRRYRR